MKKLTNVSPFILLLVPVFVMMLLTFTTSINSNKANAEISAKSAVNSPNTLVKVNTELSK